MDRRGARTCVNRLRSTRGVGRPGGDKVTVAGRVGIVELYVGTDGELQFDQDPADGIGGFRRRIAKGDGTLEQYNLDGRLVRVTDLNGNQTNYEYDDEGRLSTIT